MTDLFGVAAVIAAIGTAVAGVIAQFKIARHVDAAAIQSSAKQAAIADQITAQGSKLADIHESTNGSLTAATEGLTQARREIADLRVYIESLLKEKHSRDHPSSTPGGL